ncbi:HTH_Tnp_Tc3_2 domain-containing protein [Trichonephila clavipes]|nr:HTH_Tnp_Tc3_2 domain-containing protein [Trichonephila clavipes]
MSRIVRHNDERVREGYKRNGGKELEVSKELGITQSVISRLWQRFLDDGNVSRCYSTGRPRVTTPNEDRYLALTAKETNGAQHQTCLASSIQLPTPQQWSCVMSSDEFRFSLQSDHAGLSYGERRVPVTTKRKPLNDTVTVVQDGSFGEELFLVPELTCMFKVYR